MSFRDETSGWIDNGLSTVSEIPSFNGLSCCTNRAESDSLISAKLIGTKTVMKFDNIEVVSSLFKFNTNLLINFLCAPLGHIPADEVNAWICVIWWWCVSGHIDTCDLNCLVLEVMLDHEIFRAQNSSTRSIWCWAALKEGQRFVDHWRLHNLFDCVWLSELTIGIVDAVLFILSSNHCKMLRFSTVFFHMFSSCITEPDWCHWAFLHSSYFLIFEKDSGSGILSIWEERP